MSKKILVTYATRTGSTAGVAEAIGQTLIEHGLEIDVRPMDEVTDLTPYQAVVAGSAIRDCQWLPEAMQFIKTHQAALRQRPFAAFLVCITMSMENEQFRQGVTEWMKPVRAVANPVSEAYFAGIMDFSKLPFNFKTVMLRATVKFGVWKEGDHRDWEKIRAWANTLPEKLQAKEKNSNSTQSNPG